MTLRLEVDWPTAGASSTGVLTQNLLNRFRRSEQLIHRLIKFRDCPSIYNEPSIRDSPVYMFK